MDTVDRIFLRIKALGMEQKIFAERLGVRAQIVTDWKKRTTTSYTKRLPEIAEILETSVNYLLYGEEKKPTVSADRHSISDEDVKFALFGNAEIDDDVLAEVKRFAQFAKEQKELKKERGDSNA